MIEVSMMTRNWARARMPSAHQRRALGIEGDCDIGGLLQTVCVVRFAPGGECADPNFRQGPAPDHRANDLSALLNRDAAHAYWTERLSVIGTRSVGRSHRC